MSKAPHYVRCVKPNSKKSSGIFDQDLCLHQVRYLGLLENVRVRRAGFAYRQSHETWLARYKVRGWAGQWDEIGTIGRALPLWPAHQSPRSARVDWACARVVVASRPSAPQSLCPRTWPKWVGPARDGVDLIMKQMRLGKDDYRMGKTKVFIRSPKTVRPRPRPAACTQRRATAERARGQRARAAHPNWACDPGPAPRAIGANSCSTLRRRARPTSTGWPSTCRPPSAATWPASAGA